MVTSTILGPDGQPISTADLIEPQTSKTLQLRNEFQTHPSRGLTPSRLAAILDRAEVGDLIAQCELYEDMEEKDGHLASEMLKRRGAIGQLDWDIVPPSSPYAAEKANAAKLKELIAEIPDFDEMIFDVTDAIGKGYSCLEIEWQRVDDYWLPKTITHRPQSWFKIHRGYREELRLRNNTADGEELRPFQWITHTHKAKSGHLARAGMFRVLVWPYLFKNYSIADLAEFLEIYGIPLRLGKYPPGSSIADKATLLRALSEIGHNAAGIVPQGMELEFHDAAVGDPKAFEAMITWCEKTQSKVILGGTLTSQADGKTSTNALGMVHDAVRKDLRDGDAKKIAATLSRDLIYPIAALNGLATTIRRAPRFMFAVEDVEDIGTYATALPSLVNMGFKIRRQWAQERLGIPEPDADDTDLLLAARPPAPVAPPAPAAVPGDPAAVVPAVPVPVPGTAAASAQLAAGPMDPPARMVDQLDAAVSPAIGDWLAQIRALASRVDSLDALRDGILQLVPDMSLDQYAEAMAQGLAAAALAGRYEILQEAGTP
jgi:phage gp29-like protein